MRIAFVLSFLLLLPAAAFAATGAQATANVYVFSPPQVTARIAANSSGFTCSWTIADKDVGDSFRSETGWYKDGLPVPELSASVDGCIAGISCRSPVLAPAKDNEQWTCKVTVTDSYGATGNAEASYMRVPLGFLDGFAKGLADFACGFLHIC